MTRLDSGVFAESEIKFIALELCAMPFAKHQIDPAHIDTMRSVLEKVCDALLLKGEKDNPMTEMIADRIIALWRTGEHDPNKMASRILNDLADDLDESAPIAKSP